MSHHKTWTKLNGYSIVCATPQNVQRRPPACFPCRSPASVGLEIFGRLSAWSGSCT